MAGAKTANKKIEGLHVRKLDGKLVVPTLYNGRAIGHGKYMSGQVDGQIVVDDTGKPLPLWQIGNLE